MPVYPETVARILDRLDHAGEPDGEHSDGREVSFDCGGFVRFSIGIDDEPGIVTTARFSSSGCGWMLAAAETACRELEGRSLADLYGLEDLAGAIDSKMGGAPIGRKSCADAVVGACRNAFGDHRSRRVAEFSGQRALVCTCFGVSEDAVLGFIEAERPAAVDEVSAACRAGSGCGSCRMLIQELIDSANRG